MSNKKHQGGHISLPSNERGLRLGFSRTARRGGGGGRGEWGFREEGDNGWLSGGQRKSLHFLHHEHFNGPTVGDEFETEQVAQGTQGRLF